MATGTGNTQVLEPACGACGQDPSRASPSPSVGAGAGHRVNVGLRAELSRGAEEGALREQAGCRLSHGQKWPERVHLGYRDRLVKKDEQVIQNRARLGARSRDPAHCGRGSSTSLRACWANADAEQNLISEAAVLWSFLLANRKKKVNPFLNATVGAGNVSVCCRVKPFINIGRISVFVLVALKSDS